MYAWPRNMEKWRAFSTVPMMPLTRVPAASSNWLPRYTGSADDSDKRVAIPGYRAADGAQEREMHLRA